MICYSSWVPSEKYCGPLRKFGIGIVLTPKANRRPVPGVRWFLDNGAFQAWRQKYPFPEASFINALWSIPIGHKPDFIVTPDKVADGKNSLEFSISWIERIQDNMNGNWIVQYIAVQDGMTHNDILNALPKMNYHVGGIFVGGTIDWKLKEASKWVKFAHKRNFRCHIGRTSTISMIEWAWRIGADSIDSGSWFAPNVPKDQQSKFIRTIRKFSHSNKSTSDTENTPC